MQKEIHSSTIGMDNSWLTFTKSFVAKVYSCPVFSMACVMLCMVYISSFKTSKIYFMYVVFVQKDWREDYQGEFRKKVMKAVRRSVDDL